MQSIRILVATSTRGFGQLIQQTLEESSRYSVTLVESVDEALIRLERGSYSLSVLDANLKGGSLEYLAQKLRTAYPNLRLIYIPPDNDLASPIMATIPPDGYLTKPFYLPDLFDTIEEVLGDHQSSVETYINSAGDRHAKEMDLQSLDWLEDVNLATQHLTRFSLESATRAALIVRNDQLWAYAGQLSEYAVQELASTVNDFWRKEGEIIASSGDRVRFTRLKSTAEAFLLYVMALGDGIVLALAFNTKTPFSTIRTQAIKLARTFASPQNHIIEMALNDLSTQRQKLQEESIISSSPTLRPQPMNSETPASVANVVDDTHTTGTSNFARRTNLPLPALNAVPQSNSQSNNAPRSRGQSGNSLFTQRADEPFRIGDLRPVSPAVSHLNFACLLIPRIPAHHLIGELASSLATWLGQLCLAYGWRLEHQSIRPGYLLWIAHVSPVTSPSYHIRMIRKQTSQRIFTLFPQLKKENPSGDFWAPGYLIVSSIQPPAADIINQYIDHTRHHQGA
jgi:DNA-binding response OmpR family regulator/REP element-mobilizing transposase RayT